MIEHVDPPSDAPPVAPATIPLLPAVLDAVADGVTVQDRTGQVVYANATALQMIGFDSLEDLLAASTAEILSRFELLDERGAPLSPAALPGRHALLGEVGAPIVVGYRVVASGSIRWSQVRAMPLRDVSGSITHAINTFHDVTDRMRIEADLRASEASYRLLVEAMPQIAWTTDPAGRVLMVNERWREYRHSADMHVDGLAADEAVHPAERAEIANGWAASLAQGEPLECAVRLRRHDGAYRWHLVRAVPVHHDDEVGGWIGTSTDIDDERRARAAARLLAEAAERLDESLDPASTADAAATIAVPELADVCIIDLLEPNGRLRRAAVAVADPADDDVATGLRGFVTDPDGGGPLASALRRAQVDEIPDFDDHLIDRAAGSAEHAALIRQLVPRSGLAVPLVARGRTLGGMFLISKTPHRYDAGLVALAEDLARRVALALSNSELYAAEQAARETAEATAARMDALQRITRTLARASTRDEVVRVTTQDGAAALGASGAVLAIVATDGSLEVAGAEGDDAALGSSSGVTTADELLPMAQALRERKPIWLREPPADVGDAAVCAIPLLVEDRAIGVLGLAFATHEAFDRVDRDVTLAQANVVAQALDRVSLNEAREHLLNDLEAQRNRLEAVLRQMPAGVLIADASGQLVLANRLSGEIWPGTIPIDRPLDDHPPYVAFGPDGEGLPAGDWPLARALRDGETVTGETLEIERLDGTRGWISVDAAPIRGRSGEIVAAVSTFSDVTAEHLAAQRQAYLAEASAVLASSLDYEETIARVMRLAVPSMADWAVVDLVGQAGVLDRLVVAHTNPARIELARELRERFPPDPDAPTGAAAVARTGIPELVPAITPGALALIPNPELRRIVEELELHSYMSVPLRAGGETLGVVTFVAAESGRRYGEEDLRLAEALAARAASAIQNARLFRDVARFKAILDATLDAVFMFDPDASRILYVNQGGVDQLGWEREQLLGMAPRDLIEKRDEPRLRALVGPLVEGRIGSHTLTVTLRHREGRRVPVEVLLQYVEPPGETGRIVAIARDISERVEAQARLQGLAEAEHARAAELNAVIRAMGEGVVVCDARGLVVLANPAAEALFPDFGGRHYEEILSQLDDPDRRAPALGKRGDPVELRIVGEPERWIELSTYPVAARDGGIGEAEGEPETIVLLRDITMARQRQAVRDTFIGVLSHELRTPVTTIYAGSKVLARGGGLDEEVRRSVFEDIHIEAERLHRLVEDVIALTRFGEQDEAEIGKEPVLLQRILPAVLRSEEARWPGVSFELSVPGGVPTVVADPTYVEQVVRNLLSNAAKYGGQSARVRAVVEPADGEVLVRILDTGPGFPPDEADRLFELFFRSPSTAATAGGAGIGLFVSSRLIRAMGGRIWARSRPEGGAEFGFSLRVMDEEDPPA